MRSQRFPPQEKYPFRALAVVQRRSEVDVAEDSCKLIVAGATGIPPTNDRQAPPALDDRLDVMFTMQELDAALASTRRSSAPGPDGITYAALRSLGKEARTLLLSLFNASWSTGTVPEKWKTSRVVALLKPGKAPHALASYRPIALASCVGKVMEKMLLTRLE